ncbi:DUF2690 domain-containing protein [Streptomyces sp. NPDC059708]|uniref:DUF2690 domain-containing protein n=1 Tax=Streptomyces sp. NPDC059708 TaxID=3346916 RepID=UPI0036CDF3CD
MNTPLTRKFAVIGSTLAVAASSLILASSPASAATSCYADGCQGRDPSSTTCQNDARTVATSDYPGVELRYSPTCRAAWARYSRGIATWGMYVTVQRQDGNGSYSTHYYGNGASVWTPMVNDKDLKSRACGYADDGSGAFGCTDWY